MTTFRLNMDIDKFLHQNRAEVIDCVEGVLLDNLLATNEKAVIGFFETYAGTWNSVFTVYYAKHGTPEATAIYDKFNRLSQEVDALRGRDAA